MHGIGEFAQMAKVSVRTLRHYDDIDLLTPAHTDPMTGYRSYESGQLADLHRILALKDAGLTLVEIRAARSEGEEVVAAMLRDRLEALEASLDAERQRVGRLRARLQLMSGEHPMSEHLAPIDADIVVKPLDGYRVAAASATAPDFEADFAPIFAELYPTIFQALALSGIEPGQPPVAFYDVLDSGEVLISAGVPVPADAELAAGSAGANEVRIEELPSAARGATLIHRGPMTTVDQSFLALDQWITEAGETIVGCSREIYHDCPPGDQSDWVTELQFILG